MRTALGGLGDIYAAGQLEALTNLTTLPRMGGQETELYLLHQKFRERDWTEIENAIDDFKHKANRNVSI